MDASKEERREERQLQERRQEEDEEGKKPIEVVKEGPKAKSCKGYLYYSSSLKSRNRNPRCIGVPRTLPRAPKYNHGPSEAVASENAGALFDFYYACAGYSVYTNNLQDGPNDKPGTKRELPVCFGLEVLVDRPVANAKGASTPAAHAHAHTHNREDVYELPRSRAHSKPGHSSADDFLSRFTRNANLVASGVARNMRRVGNYMKESVDDILYPHRKRPK